MITRRSATSMLLLGPLAARGVRAQGASAPIRIGDISSYSALPQGTEGYRNGWQLAVEEINAAGGLLGGRKLEVILRDDAGRPDMAARHAEELVTAEKVDLLMGSILSHTGLAVAAAAERQKIYFLAAQPLTNAIVWEKGNRYTFRLRTGTYSLARMMADEAAKLPARRWATIAPNYEYGQSAVATFKERLRALQPDVEFVEEQWPGLDKLAAAPTVQALIAARPDALFNVTFGADLAKLAREGRLRGLFRNRPVLSLLTGEPEYLDPLRGDAPEGWIVTGYPWSEIREPAHERFVAAYRTRYNAAPKIGSLMGYTTIQSIAASLRKAGGTGTEALIAATEGLRFDSPVGPIAWRALDHQSTMGSYVGRIALKDGQGVMVDWRYLDGADYQPDDAAVRALRPGAAG